MTKLRISETYKRWRHTRGYGVHSPFAYSLVKGVVRPGRAYRWYGYQAIEQSLLTQSSAKIRKEARMLLRLAAFLRIDSAYLPAGNDAGPYLTALLAADSGTRIVSALGKLTECRMICTSGTAVPLTLLKTAVMREGCVIAARDLPAAWIEELYSILPTGLMLRGKKNVIIINRPDMQKLAYTVRI